MFAGGLGCACWVLKRNALKNMLGEQMQLPEAVWKRLNLSWILFFAAMGALNLLVAFHNPWCHSAEECTAQWVNFKLFGGMGLMLLFVLAQGLLLSKYIEDKR